jgi:hypothetical protein
MSGITPRTTQLGLGMDEDEEAARVDAWWDPPPMRPISCPPPRELDEAAARQER